MSIKKGIGGNSSRTLNNGSPVHADDVVTVDAAYFPASVTDWSDTALFWTLFLTREDLVQATIEAVGMSPPHAGVQIAAWKTDCEPLVRNFTEMVEEVPASKGSWMKVAMLTCNGQVISVSLRNGPNGASRVAARNCTRIQG